VLRSGDPTAVAFGVLVGLWAIVSYGTIGFVVLAAGVLIAVAVFWVISTVNVALASSTTKLAENVEVHELPPVSHNDILKEPYVRVWAAKLKGLLQRTHARGAQVARFDKPRALP